MRTRSFPQAHPRNRAGHAPHSAAFSLPGSPASSSRVSRPLSPASGIQQAGGRPSVCPAAFLHGQTSPYLCLRIYSAVRPSVRPPALSECVSHFRPPRLPESKAPTGSWQQAQRSPGARGEQPPAPASPHALFFPGAQGPRAHGRVGDFRLPAGRFSLPRSPSPAAPVPRCGSRGGQRRHPRPGRLVPERGPRHGEADAAGGGDLREARDHGEAPGPGPCREGPATRGGTEGRGGAACLVRTELSLVKPGH